jgi:hypothetical protein
VSEVKALVDQHIEYPQFGFLGQTRINVLKINIALDELARKGKGLPGKTAHILFLYVFSWIGLLSTSGDYRVPFVPMSPALS